MSRRRIHFLDKWMAKHLPDAMTDDPLAISDLADQAKKRLTRHQGNQRGSTSFFEGDRRGDGSP
jgi:hypothetical protein